MHPITVHSDRRALKQILINLTNNAIKFTDDGGVRLRLSSLIGGEITFTSETGEGTTFTLCLPG